MRVVDGTLERLTSPLGHEVRFRTKDIEELDVLLNRYKNKPLQVKIEPIRAKRSLNANAYHYKLCGDIAKVINSTAEDVHRQLMIDYGTPMEDKDGLPMFTLLMSDPKETGIYVRPTGQIEPRKGKNYQWYVIIKPSHLYNTKEMSVLIDGTVSEAKELEIETMTPDEIDRMKQQWGA